MILPCMIAAVPASPIAWPHRRTRPICLSALEIPKMAIELKKTDVLIVGMGATGGVAALPLAQAGLEGIGLEAGTWLSPSDFAPDGLRNNYRGWPQFVHKANPEGPNH